MKRFVQYLAPALVILFLCTPMLAQGQTAAGGYKIGVVDMDRLREDHAWLKGQYKALEDMLKKLESEIEPLLKEIDALSTQLKEGAESLSPSERLALKSKYDAKTLEHQNEIRARQLKIDERELEVNKEAYADIQKVIGELANDQNYHLIIKAQNDPRSQVLYFSAAIDVTSEVVARLNKLKK